MGLGFVDDNHTIILIGATHGHLGQSLYLRELHGLEIGPAPPVDLSLEKKHGEAVRELITQNLVTACHDVSDGGVLIALCEMAMAGNIGFTLATPHTSPAFWFGEDQGRYLVTTVLSDELQNFLTRNGISFEILGQTQGKAAQLPDGKSVNIADLVTINESWLPNFMAGAKS